MFLNFDHIFLTNFLFLVLICLCRKSERTTLVCRPFETSFCSCVVVTSLSVTSWVYFPVIGLFSGNRFNFRSEFYFPVLTFLLFIQQRPVVDLIGVLLLQQFIVSCIYEFSFHCLRFVQYLNNCSENMAVVLCYLMSILQFCYIVSQNKKVNTTCLCAGNQRPFHVQFIWYPEVWKIFPHLCTKTVHYGYLNCCNYQSVLLNQLFVKDGFSYLKQNI